MTVFAKTNRYGLEVPVTKMQNLINSNLSWAGTNNIYGIIFSNAEGDNVIPEAWIGTGVKGNEYKQVFNNDKITSTFGFIALDRNIVSGSAIVQIVCTVNLAKAFEANVRDNERAYLDVQNILSGRYAIIEDSFQQGIEDVFSGFKTDDIKYLDMQPYDCFSFEVEMSYPNNAPCQ